jgi:phenylacetate-CoA ligase
MVRYRTRDLTAITLEPCPCGRTLARMARVASRTDDLLVVGGVKLFPAQLEQVLTQVEGVEPHYRVLISREGRAERIEVQVEVSSALLTGDVGRLLKTENLLKQKFQAELGLAVELKFVEPRTIGPVEHPSQRVIDAR